MNSGINKIKNRIKQFERNISIKPDFTYYLVDNAVKYQAHKNFGMDSILEEKKYRDNSLSIYFTDKDNQIITATSIFLLNPTLQKETYFWFYDKKSNYLKKISLYDCLDQANSVVIRFGFMKSVTNSPFIKDIFMALLPVAKDIMSDFDDMAFMEIYGNNTLYTDELEIDKIALNERGTEFISNIGKTRPESKAMEIFSNLIGLKESLYLFHISTIGKIFINPKLNSTIRKLVCN